jgi:HrpA-like RNA helicase
MTENEIVNGDNLTGKEKIELCRKIVREHQYQKVRYHFHYVDDGKDTISVRTFLLDGTTANAICQVYDNLSPENQQRYLTKHLVTMADMAWRLIAKNGG